MTVQRRPRADEPRATASGRRPRLDTLTLELTYRCHRRCTFCYQAQLYTARESRTDELDGEQWARLIAPVIDDSGCQQVQLSGGEPLLRTDLLEVVNAVRQRVPKVSIITDGAHLDAPLATKLSDLGVHMVQLTLLAGGADVHDSLRGAGSFADATRAIATAAAAGLKVSASMVVTRQNYREASKVAELCFALGAQGMALSRFCSVPANHPAFERLMPSAGQVRYAAEAAAEMCESLGLPLAAALTIPRCVWGRPEHPPLRVGVCALVGSGGTLTLSPTGAVRSCSLSTRTHGTLGDEPWPTIAERLWVEELEPLRRSLPVVCEDCTFARQCLGGCRLSTRPHAAHWSAIDPLAPVTHEPADSGAT